MHNFLNSLQSFFYSKTMAVIVGVIWLFTRFMKVVVAPLSLVYHFKKSITCPPIRNKILLLPASVLAQKIRRKQLSAEEVVKVFIERIEEVNPILNAVVEERFREALEEARKIDKTILIEYNEDEIERKWPLLGVPITIKSSLAVAGLTHTAGKVNRKIIADTDAVAVKLVKDAGAILLLTSNVPELCLNWETTNKLIGTTRNPYKSTRTVGGSSGGETSLLSAGASPLGIGSDIAGSLRLPAHYCGVFGHKPSPFAVSVDGHFPDSKIRHEWCSVFTVGPLARFVGDLRLLLNIIAEPSAKKMLKLHEKVDVRQIKVFYMDDNGSTLADRVDREILNVLNEVIQVLDSKCLNKCEKTKIPSMRYSSELSYVKLLNTNVDGLLDGEDENVYLELLRLITGQSKSVISTVFVSLLKRNVHLIPNSMKNQVDNEIDNLKRTFLSLLENNGVFICPTSPNAAHYHGEVLKKIFNGGYMSIFNALGFPATHCHIKLTKDGLPIGVQIVAAPNCDNLTLTVAEELERHFGGWDPIYDI